MDSNLVKSAFGNAVNVLRGNLPTFTEKFQYSHSENNFYSPSENVEWTTGFCTGEYWLAYEHTKDEKFKDAGLSQAQSFLNRIEEKIDVDHHDMGFLYSPSCVAAYKLTGSEVGKKAAILAADNLISRFHEKGQFIQAWGELGAKDNYRMIIDCMLNLPLLFWATDVTGDSKYRDIAVAHGKTSIKYLIKDDFSTYHTYYFDQETGEPIKGVTAQGYRDNSAWARGQAWGVYGLALIYPYINDKSIPALFEGVTEFFINKLPKDKVPYWDLDFTDGDDEPKDSSAGAIAACGMLEMCKYLDKDKGDRYKNIAKQIAKALIDDYSVKDPVQSNGLLLHGTYAKKSPYNTVNNRGVDECNTWGDYFYLELLTRINCDWKMYW